VTEVAAPRPVEPELEITGVMRETWTLYRDLFTRSVLVGLLVFAALGLLDATSASARPNAALLFAALVVPVAGTALVQGALVNAVEDDRKKHPRRSVRALLGNARPRFGALLGVSVLTGLGVGLGLLFFVAPGIVLFTRWSLSVPVVMLEGLSPRAAMRRSRQLVRGRWWSVFCVLLNVAIPTVLGAVAFRFALFSLLGRSHGILAAWLSGTIASALATPYAAHAMSVVYYRLTAAEATPAPESTDPRWTSVWHEP
jgi:uncharacterized membrane protein YesL